MSTDGHDSGAKSGEAASIGLDAEQLRARRLESGLTRAALASALGCSPHTIQAWEQGKRSVPQHIAPDLARVALAAKSDMAAHDAAMARLLEAAPRQLCSGAELRAMRQELALSRRELAEALGYSSRTIGDWEQGRRKIPSRLADEILRVWASMAAERAQFLAILRDAYEAY